MARYFCRAQLLADTFDGQWKQGIPVSDVKAMVTAAANYETETRYLLASDGGTKAFPRGLMEPLAAGSGRVWSDRSARNLMVVVDIGAGTTDFSLFWVLQNAIKQKRRAVGIEPGSDAIRMAGDMLDKLLLGHLLSKAPGKDDSITRRQVETALRLRGTRRMKETLFATGKLECRS